MKVGAFLPRFGFRFLPDRHRRTESKTSRIAAAGREAQNVSRCFSEITFSKLDQSSCR